MQLLVSTKWTLQYSLEQSREHRGINVPEHIPALKTTRYYSQQEPHTKEATIQDMFSHVQPDLTSPPGSNYSQPYRGNFWEPSGF